MFAGELEMASSLGTLSGSLTFNSQGAARRVALLLLRGIDA
jgi:hypothetical protein